MVNWDQMIVDHSPIMVRLAQRILGPGSGSEDEDVVQEVFLEAFQLRPQDVRNWRGMLSVMVIRRAMKHLRQRHRTESLDAVDLPGPGSSPYENAVAAELSERLRKAIAELPDEQAAVFSLRYFENLSYCQIAESLRMAPDMVGMALHRARARLQTLLRIVIGGSKS
jgi:RNA polymerase sigma-70 factor (ECF subfamily)